jgi:hypothetical protein
MGFQMISLLLACPGGRTISSQIKPLNYSQKESRLRFFFFRFFFAIINLPPALTCPFIVTGMLDCMGADEKKFYPLPVAAS